MTFDAIYAKYNRTVYNYLKFKIKDQLVAEELAADVMVKIHKKLDTFNSDLSTLSTWIMNIAKYTMIDHFRKKTLRTVSLDQVHLDWANGEEEAQIDHLKALKDSDYNPEERLIRDEVSRTMYEKYDTLTESEKTVAALHFFDGLSYDEVASQLSMPLGTVKAKLFKARKTMMEAVPVELRKFKN
jgi:RNA polymerase sigma-70 factor (ECF subfamily)